jgi:hypothetical protein
MFLTGVKSDCNFHVSVATHLQWCMSGLWIILRGFQYLDYVTLNGK